LDPADVASRVGAVLWGTTIAGRTFRPSDWTERLAGLTSAFGVDQKLAYSPLVLPVSVRGVKALIVDCELEQREPRLYQFFLNFARDNELTLAFVADAMREPQRLVPPGMDAIAAREPREPV
jgi:hypothetical protein